jgi:hypothetical protein
MYRNDAKSESDMQSLPDRILFPTDWFPTGNQKHQEMLDAFTIHLEKYLAITRTEISLSETWAQTGPEGEKETPLRGYLQKVCFDSVNILS